MSDEPEKRGRGRRTKEQEAREWLREQGVDPDEVLETIDETPVPETLGELAAEFKKLLWRRRHNLGDTAFSTTLTALAKLAEADKAEQTDAVSERTLVADVIAGIVHLEPERKRAILEAELAALDVERDRIRELLDDRLAAV